MQQPAAPKTSVRSVAPHVHFLIGIILVVCGALSIIFNIVDLAVVDLDDYEKGSRIFKSYYFEECSTGFVGHGFWCGGMCVVTGVVSFLAGALKTRRWVFTFMVLTIIAGALCIGQFVAGVIGASRASEWQQYVEANEKDSDRFEYDGPCQPKTQTAMQALLAILAVIAGVVATFGSVSSCHAVGCCSDDETGVSYGHTPQPHQQVPAMVTTTAHQY